MTVKQAWKDARSALKGKAGEQLDFVLVQVLLRLLVLTPCMFLMTGRLKILAVLSPVLWILVIPVIRRNSAAAQQRCLGGGELFSTSLVDRSAYGQKLGQGLRTGLCLLLWALPFIAATLFIYRVMYGNTVVGQTDVFSVLMTLSDLGGGDIVRGTIYAMCMYLATLLPFVFGLSFHSGNRHARALNDAGRIRGHRGLVIRTWWSGIALLLPFLLVCGYFGIDYAGKLVDAVNNMAASGLHLPSLGRRIYFVLGAFVVFVLPLIPLRSMLTAACVRGLKEDRDAA